MRPIFSKGWFRFLQRRRWDEERASELESHLQIEIDENIARGLSAEQARSAAYRKLGNRTRIREEIYRMNSLGFFEKSWQDLRYGARNLARAPGFALAAIVTLSLGIGANTAIFSVVNAALIRPLPYKQADRLIVMRGTSPRIPDFSISYPDFLDFRRQSRAFEEMAAAHQVNFNLAGITQPENVNGYAVSPNFLSMIGVAPLLGRDFLPSEEKQGTAPVALLDYKLWQSHFGGDPNVLGRTLKLDGRSFTIVGLLPARFIMPDKADLLVPVGVIVDSDMMERGHRGDMYVFARLAPGVAFEQARSEMVGLAASLSQQFPLTNRNDSVTLTRLRDYLVGDMRPALLIVLGAVLFVLLIACVNVANLFLVRGAARTREIAVRLALGASRRRVIRQMLTESLLLAFIGGAVGIGLAFLGTSGLIRLIPADMFPDLPICIDLPVLLFASAITVLVAGAFGLMPALGLTRPDIQKELKEGTRSATPGSGQQRLRSALVIAETALALVLLVGAGLMLKSLHRLLQVSPGIQPDRVLAMEMDLKTAQYSRDPAILGFWQQLLGRVGAIPGVQSAAVGTVVPLMGDHSRSDISIDGRPLAPPGERPHPDYHIVSAAYLRTLRLPLLRGRDFTESDNETGAAVGLINLRLAQTFWPGSDPIGQRFMFGHPEEGQQSKWITIVGVVGDTRLYGLDKPSRFEVYVPYRQDPTPDMDLIVHSSIDPGSLASAIRAAVVQIDKEQPIFDIHTLSDLLADSVSTRRVTLILLGLFSGLALALAAVGIYGVMAYNIALRTHEIGIRMALGAQNRDVLRMVLGHGTRVTLIGVAIGIGVALALTRLLSMLLFGVAAYDPVTFLAVALLLIGVALLACYIPAARAVDVDPIVALRYE